MSPSRRMRRAAPAIALGLLGAFLLFGGTAGAAPGGPVALGTAESFAVLAGSGITNTGPTAITGDVGTFPTTTRTGFGSVTLTGTDHGGDAVTQGAKDDLVTAYDDAAGRTPATPTAVELGGSTLYAGVYTSGTFGLTGTLILDAQDQPDAMFVFQAASTLITESGSRVVLVNGANPCNVVWQVGSSATFKTGTEFAGDVLAYTSITAQTSATFVGRLLARNGAVTLDTNTIDSTTCAAVVPTASTSPVATATASATSAAPGLEATTAPPTGVVPSGAPASTASRPRTAVAVPSATPSTPPRTHYSSLTPPFLPRTGLREGLVLSGVVLLVLGGLALATGHATPRPRGQHRRT